MTTLSRCVPVTVLSSPLAACRRSRRARNEACRGSKTMAFITHLRPVKRVRIAKHRGVERALLPWTPPLLVRRWRKRSWMKFSITRTSAVRWLSSCPQCFRGISASGAWRHTMRAVTRISGLFGDWELGRAAQEVWKRLAVVVEVRWISKASYPVRLRKERLCTR